MNAASESENPAVTKELTPAKSRWRMRLKWFAVRVAVAYLGACLMLGIFQRHLMYIPRRGPVTLEQAEQLAPRIREVSVTSQDGLTLNGWLCLADSESPMGRTTPLTKLGSEGRLLVIMFPGNAGNRASRLSQLALYSGLGCDALLVDYRGYGDNAGSPSEKAFLSDARTVWDHAVQRWGVPPERIVISGESLGGGVAVALASEVCSAGQPPAALILRAPFTSMVDAASHNYPWLPVRWILIDRYESLQRIPQVDCPLLIYHGTKDRIIPFELGKRLFESAPATSKSGLPRRFLEIPEAGHNDIYQIGSREITRAIDELLSEVGRH